MLLQNIIQLQNQGFKLPCKVNTQIMMEGLLWNIKEKCHINIATRTANGCPFVNSYNISFPNITQLEPNVSKILSRFFNRT